MIGQGVYVKSSSPPPPYLDACNTTSEVLAFCSSFNNTATTSTPATTGPPPPPPATAGEPRRLLKAPHPTQILKCPRCASLDTKFCYYNNYNLSQPRYFCKNCKRYWTAGGALRNVPVGGGLRKNKRCKLKLVAEAEAAAAAACKSSSQQQHFQGNPPSPLQVASPSAMGGSTTSTNSSVVSGTPVNFTGPMPPTFLPSHTPTSTHLPRTSSGSDASTIDYAGNDNCTTASGETAAALLMEQQHNSSQLLLQHFFGDLHASGMRPQFYASHATRIASSCNQQYKDEEGGKSSHYAMGYGSTRMSLMGMEQVVGSKPGGCTVSGSYSDMVGEGRDGFSGNHGSIKNEKEEIISSTYDWQFISENFFNGDGTEGFLPLPGGSWPDFSQ